MVFDGSFMTMKPESHRLLVRTIKRRWGKLPQ